MELTNSGGIGVVDDGDGSAESFRQHLRRVNPDPAHVDVRGGSDPPTIDHGRGTEVTAREAEVLSLLGRHLTNVQIAETLCISVRTVESHVSALLRKFQLRDRRSLARQAAGSTCCAATECGR